MENSPLDERTFTDREVREILRLAVQKSRPRSVVKREGLSLAELKSIAAEVGIDPGRLEDAARAVALGGGTRADLLLGGPRVMTFEREVEGELDPADTPALLSLIRRTMGHQGEVAEVHGSLEWTAKGDSGERYVTLSSREGTTTISGSANLTSAAILTFFVPGILGGITALASLIKFVQDGSLVALVIGVAVLPVLYPILRAIFSRLSGSEAAKLQQVVDDLARQIEDSGT